MSICSGQLNFNNNNNNNSDCKCLSFAIYETFYIFTGLDMRLESSSNSLITVADVEMMKCYFSYSSSTDSDNNSGTEPSDSSLMLCEYYIKGICRFRKNCRFSHNIGIWCPHCHTKLPRNWTKQSKHLRKCYETIVLNQEIAASFSQICTICESSVLLSGKKFGLLSDCDHVYCLQCISFLTENDEICCIQCQKISDCCIPRDYVILESNRKTKLFALHRKNSE